MKWIYTIRNSGSLERFHTRNLLFKQNIATHSFNVAFLSLEIAQNIKNVSIEKILKNSLIHDASEIYTSDVSGEVKQDYPNLKQILSEIENDWIEENVPNYLMSSFDLSEDERCIVKFADLLDALMVSLVDLRLGNHMLKPAVKNLWITLENKLSDVGNVKMKENVEHLISDIRGDFEIELRCVEEEH